MNELRAFDLVAREACIDVLFEEIGEIYFCCYVGYVYVVVFGVDLDYLFGFEVVDCWWMLVGYFDV